MRNTTPDETLRTVTATENEHPHPNAVTATVTFHPQIPYNKQLLTPDDTWTYTVPVEDVVDKDGNIVPDDTAASDRLHRHENAPEIARKWCELTDWPYKITIDTLHVNSGTESENTAMQGDSNAV